MLRIANQAVAIVFRRPLIAILSTVIAVVSSGLAPITVRADSSPMTYHQGPVITDPLVYVVFWGPEWQNGFVDPTDSRYTGGQAITYITRMFADMGGSSWLNTVTQYSGIHNPTNLYKTYWVDSTAPPSNFQQSDVLGEAIAAADHFQVYSANVMWFIVTGPNKKPSDMPSNWCGYHDYLIGSNQAFAYIPYAPTMPNCYTNWSPPGFSNDSFGHGHFDGFSITGGHELAEAITDPYFNGWCRDIVCGFLNRSDEIGDLCESSQGNSYGKTWMHNMYYAVQGLWSNSSASCALPSDPKPSPNPACTLASISANPASQATGNPANFRGQASCPTPTYQFQVRSSTGAVIVTQSYGLEWTFGWTATTAGTYTIEVDARDKDSTATGYESNSVITYPFVGCSGATISVLSGPPVTLKATATCPGAPNYQFLIKPPGGIWSVVQGYSSASTYTWNTNGLAAGVYNLEVDVKDQGASSNEAYAQTAYTVQSVPGGSDFVGNESGDFNGDGYGDAAAMYNYGTNVTGIWIWLGNPDGSLQAPQRWWYGTSFDAGRAKIVAGNFNRDPYTDLAVIYNYGLNKTGIWIWYGPYSGFQHPTEPWYGTSFDWNSSKLTAGDYNGDGYWDIGILYNYGGSTTGFWWWPGSASGITTNDGLVWKYTTFAWTPSKVTSGDYNADGYEDLGILYNYGNSTSGIWIWLGTPSGLQNTTSRWWYGSLDWNSSKVISGTWNASAPLHSPVGYSAFTVMYNLGSSTAIYVWQGVNGAAFKSAKALWWQKAGYDWNAMKVTAVNVNGGTSLDYAPYEDLIVLYNFGTSDTGLLVWQGAPGAAFADPNKRWESTSWAWTSSQIA